MRLVSREECVQHVIQKRSPIVPVVSFIHLTVSEVVFLKLECLHKLSPRLSVVVDGAYTHEHLQRQLVLRHILKSQFVHHLAIGRRLHRNTSEAVVGHQTEAGAVAATERQAEDHPALARCIRWIGLVYRRQQFVREEIDIAGIAEKLLITPVLLHVVGITTIHKHYQHRFNSARSYFGIQ